MTRSRMDATPDAGCHERERDLRAVFPDVRARTGEILSGTGKNPGHPLPARAGERAERIGELERAILRERRSLALAAEWGAEVGDELPCGLRCCREADGSVRFRLPDGTAAEFLGHGETLSRFDSADFYPDEGGASFSGKWGEFVRVARDGKYGLILLETRAVVRPCVHESITPKGTKIFARQEEPGSGIVKMAYYALPGGERARP